jgi:hypothetical protein
LVLRFDFRNTLLPFLLISILVAGCGGGGSDSAPVPSQSVSPSSPVSILAWNPPSKYADNATLDPYRELDHYEVYVSTDGNFTDTDLPLAYIAAVKDAPPSGGNPGGKVLETEFILENIEPFIDPGNRHYVSLKAVGIDGQKSGFMPYVLWDRI